MIKSDTSGLTSGKLAKEAGVNVETIRFYERERLLSNPPRTAGGYRMFSTEAVQRVRFIRRAQTLGFTLKEVKELLALSDSKGTTCGSIRERAEQKVTEIEAKIAALGAMKEALQTLSATCSGRGPATECPILECLGSEEEIFNADR